MRKVVYTAITGDYDTPRKQPKVEGVDYILFTDNTNLQTNDWEVKHVEGLWHKEPKLLSHKYVPAYDLSLWVDGNVQLREGYERIFHTIGDNHIATFDADWWHCAYKEIQKCVECEYETPENAHRTKIFLSMEEYPEENGLSACTVILRDNSPEVNKIEELWYMMVKNFSKRDQFTFNYVLWKLGYVQSYFGGSIYNNDYLDWGRTHKQPHR